MIISVIIPTFNRESILKETLTSLYLSLHQLKNDIDVKVNFVIIDDGSTDNTSKMIKNFDDNIKIIIGDGGFWWTKCINYGVRYAIDNLNTQYVLLWNDDVLCDKNYFKNMFNILNKDKPKHIIFGSKVYDNLSKKPWASLMSFNKFTGAPGVIDKVSNYNAKYHYKCLAGMGTVIPKQVIETVGYWDEINFPQYFGDIDFTIRANKKGVDIKLQDSLIIYNKTEYSSYKGTNLKTFLESLKKENIKSRYNVYYRKKILKRHSSSFLWIGTFVSFYLKYIIKILLGK